MLARLTGLLLAGCLVAQAPSTDVAVGVFPFLVGNMDPRINEIVTNCTTHGIDTLYVSAFRATGPSTGDLWVTDSAGDWNPAWGPVRSTGAGIHLQNLITACHAANVRVVAVLKCFADTVQPDNTAHKQYLLDVIDYFVDAWQGNGTPVYDLDGIALDYVRYVGGTNVNVANVTNFVSDVRQRIGNLSLHAYLIANRYSFDGPTYNGVFNSYASTMGQLQSQFGQHWEQLAGLVDVLMPMAYTANGSIYATYALHQAYVRKTAEYARTAASNAGVPTRRVQPTIKTYTGESETTTDLTIEASITGALLGGAHFLRKLSATPTFRSVIDAELKPGPATQSDAELIADVRARAYSVFHPVGTCRMGPDARDSVVDPTLKLHGVGGLRVIDASIFPTVTSGNTNAPAIMVGEKGAELVLRDSN